MRTWTLRSACVQPRLRRSVWPLPVVTTMVTTCALPMLGSLAALVDGGEEGLPVFNIFTGATCTMSLRFGPAKALPVPSALRVCEILD